MDHDDELNEETEKTTESGSDELLSADDLRLPDGASPLVRLHAVRSWLTRRRQETSIEIGEAALALQQLLAAPQQDQPMRRREREALTHRVEQAQTNFEAAQQRLSGYDEAAALLEEYVDHITPGPRLLVEYYLALEERIQSGLQENPDEDSPHLQALFDVQHRVEHVSAPTEED